MLHNWLLALLRNACVLWLCVCCVVLITLHRLSTMALRRVKRCLLYMFSGLGRLLRLTNVER